MLEKLLPRRKSEAGLPKKFDGVIEAVRYGPDGLVSLARIYERRGPAWSDRLLITREDLLTRLKAGKKFVIGRRKPYLAGTFEPWARVRLVEVDGRPYLTTTGSPSGRDDLKQAPLF